MAGCLRLSWGRHRPPKSKVQTCLDSLLARRTDAEISDTPFPIRPRELTQLCKAACDVFQQESSLLRLDGELVVVGDVHGQFTDLLRIFDAHGQPPSARYLFLGDYVDRGDNGLEVFVLLICYKLLYPESFFMIRGNHESSSLTLLYGFYAECLRKDNPGAWKDCCEVFDTLPLAALIGERIFCVHGGLSPQLTDLNQINEIVRPVHINHEQDCLLTDLVWSDPCLTHKGWLTNPRGAGYFFGVDVLRKFNRKHGLQLVVRSHEMQQKGWSGIAPTPPAGHPALVTVFSAPNYRLLRNIGATMVVANDLSYRMREFQPALDGGLPPSISAGAPDWSALLGRAVVGQGPLLGTHEVAEMVSPFAASSTCAAERPTTEPTGQVAPSTIMVSPFAQLAPLDTGDAPGIEGPDEAPDEEEVQPGAAAVPRCGSPPPCTLPSPPDKDNALAEGSLTSPSDSMLRHRQCHQHAPSASAPAQGGSQRSTASPRDPTQLLGGSGQPLWRPVGGSLERYSCALRRAAQGQGLQACDRLALHSLPNRPFAAEVEAIRNTAVQTRQTHEVASLASMMSLHAGLPISPFTSPVDVEVAKAISETDMALSEQAMSEAPSTPSTPLVPPSSGVASAHA